MVSYWLLTMITRMLCTNRSLTDPIIVHSVAILDPKFVTFGNTVTIFFKARIFIPLNP